MSRIVIGFVLTVGLVQGAVAAASYFNDLKTEVTLKRHQHVELTPP